MHLQKPHMKTIAIVPKPTEVVITGLTFLPGECAQNSLQVARANSEVKIVEGILRIIGNDNTGKALPHMWNELNGEYFDVTAGLWKNSAKDKHITAKEYVQLKTTAYADIPKDIPLGFSEETLKAADFANRKLANWPFKFEEVVILKDPVSGKPVNVATILDYDETKKVYGVAIHRYDNEITQLWHETHITPLTVKLREEAEERLTRAELAGDPLVAEWLKNHVATKPILEIPISVPQYIVYYRQMDIKGQQFWRLLTFEDYEDF